MSGWLDPLLERLADGPATRLLLLAMPAYRPELIRAAAEVTGFVHLDFRRDVMVRAGEDPARLPLALIEATIEAHAGAPGLILQNVEALLATRPPAERRAWLGRQAGSTQPLPVVLPIALFVAELPDGPAVVSIDADDLPADTLLMRLWGNP